MFTTGRLITHVEGTIIIVPGDSIDTDRIIPARFMKRITFDGLGEYAFYDERYDEEGNPMNHPFNNPEHQDCTIMLVEKNFGCGSSREHAPQALMRYGIRALIGISFADIFAGNCVHMGIPAVCISAEGHSILSSVLKENPNITCTVDLHKKVLSAAKHEIAFTMDESFCNALVSGFWDTTSMLLTNRNAIMEKADLLPYIT